MGRLDSRKCILWILSVDPHRKHRYENWTKTDLPVKNSESAEQKAVIILIFDLELVQNFRWLSV